MSGELRLEGYTPGLGNSAVVARFCRNSTRWNGSAMVAVSSLADAAWATGLIAMTEVLTSTGTGTGDYVGNAPAHGIVTEAGFSIKYTDQGSGTTPTSPIIGTQSVTWDGTAYLGVNAPLSALAGIYHADVLLTRDRPGAIDEYTIQWFRDGVPLTGGITAPTIQVISRADGTNLIASTTPTQIGTTGAYKYDASGVERLDLGDAAIVVVTATIASATRTWRRVVGRDRT